MSRKDLICVGAITGSYGVHGEARIKSYCAEPTAIADYAPLLSEDGNREFTLTITRPVKGGFAARLASVSTKEEADALKGVRLYAERSSLPSLPDDEFYHTDLLGLEVFDTGGEKLGIIKAVLDHGAGDLLEIARPGGGQPLLLPFTRENVPTVDLARGRVIADPAEGLL